MLENGGFYPELAALSNYYAQKHGYKTHFFGDHKSIDLVKNIKYDFVTELPKDKLEEIPQCLWSLCKFVSIQMVDEPFLHLDFDLILKQNINKKILNSEIIAFHSEKYVLHKTINLQKAFPIHPLNRLDLEPMSYNCAVFGGNNYKYIKEKIKILLDFVVQNKNYFIDLNCLFNFYISKHKDHFYFPPVLIEQIWLFQLFKLDSKKIVKILGNPKSWQDMQKFCIKRNILHLMGRHKIFHKNEIIRYVNQLNIKY
jgi:hypothetical protein